MNTHDLLPLLLAKIETEQIPERQALLETIMSAPLCETPSAHLLKKLAWALHLHRMKTRPVPDKPVPPDYDEPPAIVPLAGRMHDAAERDLTTVEQSRDEMYSRLLKALH